MKTDEKCTGCTWKLFYSFYVLSVPAVSIQVHSEESCQEDGWRIEIPGTSSPALILLLSPAPTPAPTPDLFFSLILKRAVKRRNVKCTKVLKSIQHLWYTDAGWQFDMKSV